MARPRKKHNPQRLMTRMVMRQKVNAVFKPIESALGQLLATGYADVDEAGTPIFHNQFDGDTYDLAPAMAGVVTMFEMWQLRCHQYAPIEHMDRLCGLIATEQPFDEALLQAVVDSLPRLREIATNMTEKQAADFVLQTQIAIQLADNNAVQEQQQ